MPGRAFTSPADFNTQFADWLTLANTRVVRTIKSAPADLLEADRAAMLALPPIPLHLGWRNEIRLGRDYYVRLDTNDHSVDPNMIGRMVEVTADLERVRVLDSLRSSSRTYVLCLKDRCQATCHIASISTSLT